MSILLRKIRKNRWYKTPTPPWLPRGEAPADVLSDLRTSDNALSLWEIQDHSANLNRVIVAIAANADDVSNVDYITFDSRLLQDSDLQITKTPGNSHDEDANHKWHYDVVNLGASMLGSLAVDLFLGRDKICRIPEKHVTQFLRDAVSNGWVQKSRLSSKIRDKISDQP